MLLQVARNIGGFDLTTPNPVEAQARAFPVMAWVGPLVFLPIMLFVIAGVYLFVFRFLFGGDVTYGQSAAIVAWTFLAVGLVTTPLIMASSYALPFTGSACPKVMEA